MFYPELGNGGVYPYHQNQNVDDDDVRNNSALGCKAKVPTNERAYCTLMIARNGWKIPDDYPLRF